MACPKRWSQLWVELPEPVFKWGNSLGTPVWGLAWTQKFCILFECHEDELYICFFPSAWQQRLAPAPLDYSPFIFSVLTFNYYDLGDEQWKLNLISPAVKFSSFLDNQGRTRLHPSVPDGNVSTGCCSHIIQLLSHWKDKNWRALVFRPWERDPCLTSLLSRDILFESK